MPTNRPPVLHGDTTEGTGSPWLSDPRSRTRRSRRTPVLRLRHGDTPTVRWIALVGGTMPMGAKTVQLGVGASMFGPR